MTRRTTTHRSTTARARARAVRLATATSLACAAAFGLAGMVAAAPKPKVQIKVATLAPAGSTWMHIMTEMDAEVREATANGVGFKFYTDGAQGDEKVVLRRIRNGQLQGAGLTGTGLGQVAPALRILELPFMLRSDAEVDLVHATFDPEFEAMLAEKDFVLLGWAEVGSVHVFTKTPVRSRDDMSSVKMWLWEGDPVAESMFEQFQIPPVPLSIAHVTTSLQTGMVDGVYCSPYACVALQWFTRVSYMTAEPMAHATGALVISKKVFDKIPADQRQTVLTIARKHLAALTEATRQQNADALVELERHGVEAVTADADQLAGLRERSELVWTDLKGELYPADLLARVTSTLEAHRAKTASN